jgi:hypothetical protein
MYGSTELQVTITIVCNYQIQWNPHLLVMLLNLRFSLI